MPSLARLGAAAVALLVGLVVLWQAGMFSSDESGGLDVSGPDTSLQTPAVEGFDVGVTVGKTAPDFEFSSLEGERLRLSDFRGQAVLLNFWATWCRPCRTEMPAIDETAREYGDAVAVLAINKGENAQRASDWLSDLGLDDFTAFGYDPESEIYNRYYEGGIGGLPISLFIDTSGVITEVVYGPLRVSDLEFAFERALTGYKILQN